MSLPADFRQARERWRKDVLAFARDVLYWRQPGGVQKFTPYKEQADALRQITERDECGRLRHKTCCLCWPKRDAKSTTAAVLLAHDLVTGDGRTSVVVSNSREQSQTVTFGVLANFVTNSPVLSALVPEDARRQGQITCRMFGNSVRALSAKMETAQGIAVTGYAVMDDGWSAPQDTLDMVASQTEHREAQIIIPSMMGSTRGYVYRLHQTYLGGGDPRLWFDYRTTNANPAVSAEWLASRRASLPPSQFDFLHRNLPGEGGSCLFTVEQLEACRWPYEFPLDRRQWRRLLASWNVPGGYARLGCGLDRAQPWAMNGDETVWAVVAWWRDRDGLEQWAVVQCEPVPNSSEQAVLSAVTRTKEVFGQVTAANVEVYQAADLAPKVARVLGCHTELVAATTQLQLGMFNRLWQIVDEARLHYPLTADRLHEQLCAFQTDTDAGTMPRFGTPGVAVDDYVYGVAHGVGAIAQQGEPSTIIMRSANDSRYKRRAYARANRRR